MEVRLKFTLFKYIDRFNCFKGKKRSMYTLNASQITYAEANIKRIREGDSIHESFLSRLTKFGLGFRCDPLPASFFRIHLFFTSPLPLHHTFLSPIPPSLSLRLLALLSFLSTLPVDRGSQIIIIDSVSLIY